MGWLKYTTGTTYRIDSPGAAPPTYTATCPLGVVTTASPPPSSIRVPPALHPRLSRRASDRPHRNTGASLLAARSVQSPPAPGQVCRRR
uniref:Uncharacterized protein n=1 Tax=Arundo donax TaxID=35708 RepID=A0A0A9AS92_ARUDO